MILLRRRLSASHVVTVALFRSGVIDDSPGISIYNSVNSSINNSIDNSIYNYKSSSSIMLLRILVRSRLVAWLWIWQTRDSLTFSVSPISRRFMP